MPLSPSRRSPTPLLLLLLLDFCVLSAFSNPTVMHKHEFSSSKIQERGQEEREKKTRLRFLFSGLFLNFFITGFSFFFFSTPPDKHRTFERPKRRGRGEAQAPGELQAPAREDPSLLRQRRRLFVAATLDGFCCCDWGRGGRSGRRGRRRGGRRRRVLQRLQQRVDLRLLPQREPLEPGHLPPQGGVLPLELEEEQVRRRGGERRRGLATRERERGTGEGRRRSRLLLLLLLLLLRCRGRRRSLLLSRGEHDTLLRPRRRRRFPPAHPRPPLCRRCRSFVAASANSCCQRRSPPAPAAVAVVLGGKTQRRRSSVRVRGHDVDPPSLPDDPPRRRRSSGRSGGGGPRPPPLSTASSSLRALPQHG